MEAEAKDQPIVVGIVVDQLRTDYLEQLRPYFGTKGFNRLFTEGVYFPDIDFKGTVGDAATGAAVIYTGAWPSVNGVAGAELIDFSRRQSVPVLAYDAKKSRVDYTPANLRLSTIGDEFFINHGNLSKIYSVAGDPQVAVIAAGHAGTSAIWFDEFTGRWNAPAYYGVLPPVIGNKNHTSPLSSKIATTQWRPLFPASHYQMGKAWNPGDFSYGYAGANKDSFSKFKTSAPFNTEVTDAALELLKSMQTGQPGMINLEYTLAPVSYDYDGDNRPELIDSYIRLDAELGRLLEAIEKEYGAGNALVFLTSTGYAREPAIPEKDAKIPTGEITYKQAESLLNSYLSATFGNADYVAQIKNGQLFFDRRTAETKGADVKKLRAAAKEFLLKMSGVSDVVTIDEVLYSDSRQHSNTVLKINAKTAPDLFITFNPGWDVTDDNVYPPVTEKVRLGTPPTPAFILSGELQPDVVTEAVEATALAPTITSLLRIRAPNGAASKPLTLKRKF